MWPQNWLCTVRSYIHHIGSGIEWAWSKFTERYQHQQRPRSALYLDRSAIPDFGSEYDSSSVIVKGHVLLLSKQSSYLTARPSKEP